MQTKNWKIVLAILTAIVVLMAAGYTMLIPFLPVYLMRELGVPMAEVKLWTGGVFSITFLIGGIMAPIWGKMADKHGQKLLAMRSSIGLAIAYILAGLAQSPMQLFMARLVQGFAAGLWGMCMSICSSSVPPEKLGLSLGILQSGLITGNIIGPLIGGVLAEWVGMRASFYVAGGLLILITIVFFLFIPEPNKAKVETKVELTEEATDMQQVPLLRRRTVREVLVFSACVQLMVLLIQPVLALYMEELNHSSENIMLLSGIVFSSVGIASALASPWWGRLGQSKGFYKTLMWSAGLGACGIFLTSVPKTVLTFGIANFIFGLLFSGVNPSLSAILAQVTERKEKATAFGYFFSAGQFGAMLGPVIGGVISTYFPISYLFYLGAIIMASVSLYVYFHRNERIMD